MCSFRGTENSMGARAKLLLSNTFFLFLAIAFYVVYLAFLVSLLVFSCIVCGLGRAGLVIELARLVVWWGREAG